MSFSTTPPSLERMYSFETGKADRLPKKNLQIEGAYPLTGALRLAVRRGKPKAKLITSWLKKENESQLYDLEEAWVMLLYPNWPRMILRGGESQ